jgi:translation initiation factor 2 subunit 2
MSETEVGSRVTEDELAASEEKSKADAAAAGDDAGALNEPDADDFSLSLDKKKKKKKTKKTKEQAGQRAAALRAGTQTDSSYHLPPSQRCTHCSSLRVFLSVLLDELDLESSSSGTGVLPSSVSHPERDYNYTELLERVFSLLHEKNPALSTRKRYSMPPPQLVRVGTRKTMWTNFAQICALMHRQPEHVMSFLLAELGTDGSIDGNQRLVIKGRYQPKQAESLLKKYIVEYVTCHMCR